MKQILMSAIAVAIASSAAGAGEVELHRFELGNGVRVVAAQVAGAPPQTMFTFLPLSMVNDGAGRAQWAHLLEHMVIRSTDPIGLAAGNILFNGETTHAYLRYETFGPAGPGHPENWGRMLDRHATWLNGAAQVFDGPTLEREKTNIALEEQGVSGSGATTKFAMAAWNQVVHHGASHAKVHGDVAEAALGDVQKYAAERLAVDESVVIATIGPLAIEQVRADLERVIGSVAKRKATVAKAPGAPKNAENPGSRSDPAGAATAATSPQAGADGGREFKATWDLPTQHAMWFWPLPDTRSATQAAAAALARSVHIHLYTMIQNEWKQKVRTAQVYPCVEAPGKAYFLIDCCLADGVDGRELTAEVAALLKSFDVGQPRHGIMAMLAPRMAGEISTTVDFGVFRGHLPEPLRDSAEGVWLLTLMNYEYAWGVPAEQVFKEVRALDPLAMKSLLDRLGGQNGGLFLLNPP